MALSPVFGPVDITALDPAETFEDDYAWTVSGPFTGDLSGGYWDERVGLVVVSGHTHPSSLAGWDDEWCGVTPDGKIVAFGNRFAGNLGQRGWSAVHNRSLWVDGGTSFFVDFPATDTTTMFGGTSFVPYNQVLHTPRRLFYIAKPGGSYWSFCTRALTSDDAGATWGSETVNALDWSHVFNGEPYASQIGTSWRYAGRNAAGHHCIWMLNPTSGRLDLYDVESFAWDFTKTTNLGASVLLWDYSRKHNLFFVVRAGSGATRTLTVYANEADAANVSAPVFSPSPAKGGSSTLSATVTGAAGEPCAGRVVRFQVTVGSVTREYVTTNAAGVASTTFIAPTSTAAGQTATATLVE